MEFLMDTRFNLLSHRLVSQLGLPAAVAGASLVLMACASTPPPTELLAVSSASVVRAVNAGGNESAPVEMRLARDKLDKAKLAMTAKDYDLARSLALEAQVDAQLAETKAQSAKAGKASSAVKEDSRVLREELDRKTK
jgi:hypothetical protein